MVKAILEGRKTMTRRVVKDTQNWDYVRLYDGHAKFCELYNHLNETYIKCPYGQPGDRIWVRETFFGDTAHYVYKADDNTELFQIIGDVIWKSPIFMPKEAARLWLEIVNVRVERLYDISYQDIICEGLQKQFEEASPNEWFLNLWQKINGNKKENPWVWVIEFRRVEK